MRQGQCMWLRFTKCPAVPRCLCCADVVSVSLVLPCSAIAFSRFWAVPTLGPKMALQRARSCGLQLLEGAVKATLQVGVRHNQDTFLIPGHQADLLRNACVQLCTKHGNTSLTIIRRACPILLWQRSTPGGFFASSFLFLFFTEKPKGNVHKRSHIYLQMMVHYCFVLCADYSKAAL